MRLGLYLDDPTIRFFIARVVEEAAPRSSSSCACWRLEIPHAVPFWPAAPLPLLLPRPASGLGFEKPVGHAASSKVTKRAVRVRTGACGFAARQRRF
jgi:hypothetical protein